MKKDIFLGDVLSRCPDLLPRILLYATTHADLLRHGMPHLAMM
eukprot:COSAG02_NODE_4049_length_5862_cov_2.302100_5_plen_43_part_00